MISARTQQAEKEAIMAIKRHTVIQALQKGPAMPFYIVPNLEIPEAGEELIQRAAAARNAPQDSRSVPSPFGESIAFARNILNPREEVSKTAAKSLLLMYLRLAETAYTGENVTFHVRTFDQRNPLDAPCIRDRKNADGWKGAPDKLLDMQINGVVYGLFMPDLACFLPSAGFYEDFEKELEENAGIVKIHEIELDSFLAKKPWIRHRCRILLDTMLKNGADERVLSPLLAELGGSPGEKELEKYFAEPQVLLPQDVREYIAATCPSINAEIACGYPGRNKADLVLDSVTLINTGKNAFTQKDTKVICGNYVVIPPVREADLAEGVSFTEGEPVQDESSGTVQPSWIEFSAKLDGQLYCKVFPRPEEGWRTRGPECFLDMDHGVPEGILTKHNYLVRDMSAGLTLQEHEHDCHWKAYPEDPGEYVIHLTSPQFRHEKWEIRQRTSRIERLELWEQWEEGESVHSALLGCVFPAAAPAFNKSPQKACVSIDPAGAESVRLWTFENSGRSNAVRIRDIVYPITPVSSAEMNLIIERNSYPADREKSHFESLLQMFGTTDAGFAELLVVSRLWEMDQEAMFTYLSENPQDMVSAMSNLGVIANPKEMIARSQLDPVSRAKCGTALRHYIGILIMESILAMAKEGCAVSAENLEFLLSYPENGSGEGVTKMMRDAIEGAVEYVNEYLTADNALRPGHNVTLYSESEASAQWHKNHSPAPVYMGDAVAAGTPDYGHSTHDFSLRIRGRLYMFSLPYAAQYITVATLAEVYRENPAALMRCFTGEGQTFMEEAKTAISKAAQAKHGKLYENLGFILPLSRLFSQCTFSVKGERADYYQQQVQKIVEARLNIAIPAYADCIVRAIRDGVLSPDSDVLLAPVGKGSLAFYIPANGYEIRLPERLAAAVNKQLSEGPVPGAGTPAFTGRIRLLLNNDKQKESVAQGLIDLKEAGKKGRGPVPERLSTEDLTEYYLDTLFPTDSVEEQKKKESRREEIRRADTKATIKKYKDLREELYSDVFKKIMNRYTYSDFESSFNCWGYTGAEDGEFDESIRQFAEEEFENLLAELEYSRRELIMAWPGREKEMICGALIDLVIGRMTLT